VNLLWAAQYPAYKIASDHMGVATLNFWVLLLASAILAPLVIRQRRSVPRGTRVWFEFGMLALLGIIPPSVLLAWGVAHSSGANAAILSMTIPVLMSIMGVMMLGERLTIIRIVSLFLALVGTLLISRSDLAGSSFRSDLLLGNAVIFLAGAGSAFYNAISLRLFRVPSSLSRQANTPFMTFGPFRFPPGWLSFVLAACHGVSPWCFGCGC
jgi:drug/metabolite transporter (DMT)-like permease